jgi:hypothetical protein
MSLLNYKGKECLVRTKSAGVFVGIIKDMQKEECIMINARRIFYWEGAASLSQISMEGVKEPDKCRFPMSVDEIYLTGVEEYIPMRPEAYKNIGNVAIWGA